MKVLGYRSRVNVFAAAAEAVRTGRRAALATVVGVRGSAPRHAGARMLVYADGTSVGTIGGGALEHHVRHRAMAVAEAGLPERLEAHTVRDLGMCCGGQVEVYVEPLQVRSPMVMFGAGHVAHALAPMLDALDFDVTVVETAGGIGVGAALLGALGSRQVDQIDLRVEPFHEGDRHIAVFVVHAVSPRRLAHPTATARLAHAKRLAVRAIAPLCCAARRLLWRLLPTTSGGVAHRDLLLQI